MKARIKNCMNELFIFFKSSAPTESQVYAGVWGGTIGPIAGHLLGWSNEVQFLLMLMVLDFVTGMLSAYINPKTGWSSSKGAKGIAKKVMMLCLLIAVHFFELIFNVPNVHLVVTYAFITNELVSLLENARESGVDLPAGLDKFLTKALEDKQKKGK